MKTIMKIPGKWHFVIAAVILTTAMLLSSCLLDADTPSPSPSPSPDATSITATPNSTPTRPLPSPTPTLQPTKTPSPTATPTLPLPTRTPKPTRTPRPTTQPTATLTPVLFPTLDVEQMETFIADRLADNGGCELPCWWGITPGETSWETALQHFAAHGIQVFEDGALGLHYQSGRYQGRPTYTDLMEVNLDQADGIIRRIEVRNNGYYPALQAQFTTLWQRYALQPVLVRHGPPTRVFFDMTIGAPCIGSGIFPTYDMWVIYDDQGIAIRYSGLLLYDHDTWAVCPVFGQWRSIAISLWSVKDGIAPPDFAAGVYDPAGDFSVYGFLPELTTMSAQTFYETFRQPVPQACIEIPRTPYEGEERVSPDTPGLSPAEESALLVDRLLNAPCELPCWWGITPGVTAWEDVQRMFLSYGKSVSREWESADWGTQHKVGILGRQGTYPFDYVVEHVFYEKDGIVTLIGVHGHTPGWPADEWPAPRYFAQDWNRYALSQILARYGKPTQVLLHYWSEGDAPYSLGLVYEDQGILIEYMGLAHGEYTEGNYYPDYVIMDIGAAHFTDINIWLRSSASQNSMEDVFRAVGGGYLGLLSFVSTPTLEEATGMSVDAFYEVFLSPEAELHLRAAGKSGDYYP
ncbi:MAG: hypothetical protein WHX52_00880 [Anaerolineae bacterium]